MDKKEQLMSIIKANGEMQKYFTQMHQDSIQTIQSLKQELFELNIRLEEQNRTKTLYAMNTNSRRNVFSPIKAGDPNTERESELEQKINALTQRRDEIEVALAEAEDQLSETENRLKMLRTAQHATVKISQDPAFTKNEDIDEAFEFLEQPAPVTDVPVHGENILNLDAFDRTYLKAILDKRVLQPFGDHLKRLETLKKLISADPHQAQLMVGELQNRGEQIQRSLELQTKALSSDYDNKKPIRESLEHWVMELRDKHPEFVLEASVQVRKDDMTLPYVYGLTLYRLLNLFTDNIVRHANANQVRLRISINETQADVFLSDNGIGIREDYLTGTPWYSSIHRAEEWLYLLNGHLQITGAKDHGTTIRFSLPLREK